MPQGMRWVGLDVHAHASARELRVRRALAALSEDDREVLLLAGWEGLSPNEIAIAMGLRAVTVRRRLHRARRRLHAELVASSFHPRSPTAPELVAKEQNG
jgi:DNA-directed RNA polymerase specialized sigma24 family protein